MSDDIVEQVKYSAQKRILFLPHTIQQMSRPERMITTKEVAIVVATGELIEDYPDDVRGRRAEKSGGEHLARNFSLLKSS